MENAILSQLSYGDPVGFLTQQMMGGRKCLSSHAFGLLLFAFSQSYRGLPSKVPLHMWKVCPAGIGSSKSET